MTKTLRDLSPRLQKFREAVEGCGMVIRHVKGAQNLAPDSMSRAPVGGSEEVEVVLNNLRGQAQVCYRIVSSVQGDISEEVLEDPALDEMWAAADANEDYQKCAKIIADKGSKADMKSMNNHPIQAYKVWWSKLSTMEIKSGTRIMLLDSTRIVVPETMRQKVLEREHMAHQGINKTCLDIAAKYF